MAELLIAPVITAAASVLQVNNISKIKCLFSRIYYANVRLRVLVNLVLNPRVNTGRIKILRQSDRVDNELYRFAPGFTSQILEVRSYS